MKHVIFSLILIHAASAHADLDKDQEQGLKDTQEMLRTEESRKDAVNQNAKAKDIDAKVGALAGSQKNKDAIYGLASEVLEKIATESKGDPNAMQKLLLEAQANPQAFFKKYFNEKQQAEVLNIANDIEKKGGSSAPRK